MKDRADHLRVVEPGTPRMVPLATYLTAQREKKDLKRSAAAGARLLDRRKSMLGEFLNSLPLDKREQLIGAGFNTVPAMTDVDFGAFLSRLQTTLAE